MRTEKCQGRLTVYFEDPFWVGVFERIENGNIEDTRKGFEESFASGDFYNRQTQDAEHLETIVLLSRAWGETTE